MSKVIPLLPNRAIVLRNMNCAYCGQIFGPHQLMTREHVIGRRFVPRGVLAGQWNLILNVCTRCNGEKSNLEDDISVISMMPDQFGRYAIDDPRLQAEVARKAIKSRSRRTGKVVADSHEQIEIKGAFGPAIFSFNFTAPAQVEELRLYRLAHFHFRGFFYWITYQPETKRGGFVQGGFFPVAASRRADWGAPRPRWFMDLVRDWELRVHAIGADTFFKLLIRRHPEGLAVWSWAVEWNHSIRVVGFAGDEDVIRSIISNAPVHQMELVHETDHESIRFRTEVQLPEVLDDLFTILVNTDQT